MLTSDLFYLSLLTKIPSPWTFVIQMDFLSEKSHGDYFSIENQFRKSTPTIIQVVFFNICMVLWQLSVLFHSKK